MARKPLELSEEYRWLEPPSVYCDTYTVDVMGELKMIRMVFGDYVSREHSPLFRASVAMPISDVKQLIGSLTTLVEKAERAEKEGGRTAEPDPRSVQE